MAQGIKETLELLEGIKDLVVDAKAVLTDGVIDLKDLPVAMELLSQLGVLTQAVQGLDQLPSEVGDLDQVEITTLVTKVLEIVSIIKA